MTLIWTLMFVLAYKSFIEHVHRLNPVMFLQKSPRSRRTGKSELLYFIDMLQPLTATSSPSFITYLPILGAHLCCCLQSELLCASCWFSTVSPVASAVYFPPLH